MKRIHLFEFEDLSWFPNWLRICLTRLMQVMHRMLGTRDELAELVARSLRETRSDKILDLCSGSGGPMIDVWQVLKEKHGFPNLEITLCDLYPNLAAAQKLNAQSGRGISYLIKPVDATFIDSRKAGFRSMICSFHHMKPMQARMILESAQKSMQPICVLEISDNSIPIWLWWIALPVNLVLCLVITLMVRPMTWRQIIFTYLIPIIPVFFAWDGAVSNARTYTLDDIDELLEGLNSPEYKWQKGLIKGKSSKIYLLGLPV